MRRCPDRPPPRATSQWWRQTGGAGVEVTVTNQATKRPIKSATLSLVGTRYAALGDSLGRVVLDSIRPGLYEVRTRALGYMSRVDTLKIVEDERWIGEVQLPVPSMLIEECFLPAIGRDKSHSE